MYRIVSEATYKRRTRLTAAESERTERLARVIASAELVWDDRAAAKDWLLTPHPELNGKKPLDAAMSELGAARWKNCSTASTMASRPKPLHAFRIADSATRSSMAWALSCKAAGGSHRGDASFMRPKLTRRRCSKCWCTATPAAFQRPKPGSKSSALRGTA